MNTSFVIPALVLAASSSPSSGFGNYSKGYKRQPWSYATVKNARLSSEDIANTPDAIDWSIRGATSNVYNQGYCGSCWAFSTMEGVESAVFMSSGRLPPKLSVQQLVSCDRNNWGCDGGDIPGAVEHLTKYGMATDDEYPDTSSRSGRTGKCKEYTPQVTVKGMKWAVPPCDFGSCKKQDEHALAAAVAKYGPLSVCLTADWDYYHSGIYNRPCSSRASTMDHCVQLVGYNKTAPNPYWKLRNSWGTSWGEAGFIRLPFGQNACGVANEAVIISATIAAKTENEDILV